MDSRAKAVLRKELQRAEEERARLDAAIEYLRRRLREDDDAPAAVAAAAASTGPRGGGRRITAAAAAEQVLRQRGAPMRTKDVLAGVQELGAQMKDAEGMYKTLDRNDAFRRDGRGIWALAEWPRSHPHDLFSAESG